LGKKFNSKHLSIVSLNNNNVDCFFYAIIVSKKNIPLAVNRNKLKRTIREAVKEVYSKFNLSYSSNVFIYNSKKALAFKEIKKEVFLLLKKL
jgi:ribonuclease P protein component|tara:strand:+ start:736 stop:1011 length:276 start_codon:yes stop_codon:yes gene_type:complete